MKSNWRCRFDEAKGENEDHLCTILERITLTQELGGNPALH